MLTKLIASQPWRNRSLLDLPKLRVPFKNVGIENLSSNQCRIDNSQRDAEDKLRNIPNSYHDSLVEIIIILAEKINHARGTSELQSARTIPNETLNADKTSVDSECYY